jgi:hypothetical protein
MDSPRYLLSRFIDRGRLALGAKILLTDSAPFELGQLTPHHGRVASAIALHMAAIALDPIHRRTVHDDHDGYVARSGDQSRPIACSSVLQPSGTLTRPA